MQFFKRTSKRVRTQGFTLIETLVAIIILTVAIAGPLTIASKSLSSALLARDQITAFFLAQEGVELVRNTRDTNSLTGNPWLSGIPNTSGGPFSVDGKTLVMSTCSGVCPYLKYDEASGFYTYASGEDTDFRRTLSVVEINPNEVEIAVTVEWVTGIYDRSFTIREHILDWQ